MQVMADPYPANKSDSYALNGPCWRVTILRCAARSGAAPVEPKPARCAPRC